MLILGGAVAGFVNTLAGGGSFLTVPLLIFLGLPPTVANATNRVGVAAQSLAAMGGFKQENVPGLGFALRLLPATLVGSWLGAWFASSVSDEFFGRAFGLVMLAMLPVILLNPRPRGDAPVAGGLGLPLQLLVYFGIGLYGGAVQAGIGIPLLLALVAAGGLDLVRANSVKVVVVAALTLVALVQFVWAGKSALGLRVGTRRGKRGGRLLGVALWRACRRSSDPSDPGPGGRRCRIASAHRPSLTHFTDSPTQFTDARVSTYTPARTMKSACTCSSGYSSCWPQSPSSPLLRSGFATTPCRRRIAPGSSG